MMKDSDIKPGESFNESEKVSPSPLWNPNKDLNENKEVKQIGSIKEEAKAYEPKQTKTIDELEKVSVDLVLTEDTYDVEEDGKPKSVTQKICNVDGEEYRVPYSVLKDLKVILEDNPELKFFKVKKVGEGLKTNYTVIPVTE